MTYVSLKPEHSCDYASKEIISSELTIPGVRDGVRSPYQAGWAQKFQDHREA